jgi:hypothetical protein
MGEVVEVHLVIHQENEDLSVDFAFNKQTDNVDSVVGDLVVALGVAESEKTRFRDLIERQIFGPPRPSSPPNGTSFEPISGYANGHTPTGDDYQSDDGDINDAEYRLLLEDQRQQMDALLAQQVEERRELIARLRSGEASPPINPPSSQDDVVLWPPTMLPDIANPVVPPRIDRPSLGTETCDDLIVF